MGWRHRLSEIDVEKRTAVCEHCGPVTIRRHSGSRNNGVNFWRCNKSDRKKRKPHRKSKGDFCEICGFIPIHPCQLDVHHLDNDHKNNTKENLQTVCANCHRYIHRPSEISDSTKLQPHNLVYMATKQEQINWVLDWLTRNAEASVLNQQFHEEFRTKFGGSYHPTFWGAEPVAKAMVILRQLAKANKLEVRRVRLGVAWQPGFPRTCISYSLPKVP